jgi:hypothetical protein
MALFNDIRSIINPLPNKYYNDIFNNIDSILENIIINIGCNNSVYYNSFIFNHILYSTSEASMFDKMDIKNKVIECSKKHLSSNVRNQRIHFRELNRKNKLNISDFNIYFDNFYKLLNKLNAMFLHINNQNDNYNDKFKWGTSVITNTGIDCICRFLCEDIIFKSTILKYVNNKLTDKTNDSDMYKLNMYMNIFSDYMVNSNGINWYENTFLVALDEALIKTIPYITCADIDAEQNIIDVNNFAIMNKYYNESYKTYYYITKQYTLKLFNIEITNNIKNILSNNDIYFVKEFIVNYKKELGELFKHKSLDIIMILLSFNPNDFQTFISYYFAINAINLNKNDSNDYINLYVKDKVNSSYGSEQIEELANIINSNILNNQNDYHHYLYYKLGQYFKNQDEYIMVLCQKLMERCIYSNVNHSVELDNYNIMNSIYSDKKILYNYNKILKDKDNSDTYGSSIINFLITSNELWKFNYSIGYSETIINSEEFTTLICNCIAKYNINESSNNKKLIGYPHIGFVDITILNSNIVVLPAHMFILEHFNEVSQFSFKLLVEFTKMNMSNYPNDFIFKLFDSLFISKILIKNENDIILNKEYLSQHNQINVIDIFNIGSINKVEIKKQIDAVLAHDRDDIIKTNISHFIKIKDYNIDELFKEIYDNINVFEVTREMFNKALDFMMKNDYVIKSDSDNSTIKKLVYS